MSSKAELRKKAQNLEELATLAHVACSRAEKAEKVWLSEYQRACRERDAVQKTLDDLPLLTIAWRRIRRIGRKNHG